MQEDHGQKAFHLIAHSWGGVIATCACARGLVSAEQIKTQVFLGTKRTISQRNLKRFFLVDVMWRFVLPFLSRLLGYVPMQRFSLGSDNETRIFLQETVPWLNGKKWQDSVDGFDYAAAATQINWPPTWTMTGINDAMLGHPDDVRCFAEELKAHHMQITTLGKKTGYAQDYDHIDILTAKSAVSDHFPEILDGSINIEFDYSDSLIPKRNKVACVVSTISPTAIMLHSSSSSMRAR